MKLCKVFAHIVCAALISTALPVIASCGDDHSSTAPICSSGSPWREFSNATFRYAKGDAKWEMSGTFLIGEGNDFQLAMSLKEQEKKFAVEFTMIDGTALLIRGDKIEGRYAYDYMDGIAVPIQLPITILDLVLPKGPQQLTERKEISIHEEKRRIDTATVSRGDHYGPPWRATGYAKRIGDATIEFDISIVYRPTDFMGKVKDGPDESMHSHGTLTFDTKKPFPDSMSVVGWRIPGADETTESTAGAVRTTQSTKVSAPKFDTVGEVRKAMKKAAAVQENSKPESTNK